MTTQELANEMRAHLETRGPVFVLPDDVAAQEAMKLLCSNGLAYVVNHRSRVKRLALPNRWWEQKPNRI